MKRYEDLVICSKEFQYRIWDEYCESRKNYDWWNSYYDPQDYDIEYDNYRWAEYHEY